MTEDEFFTALAAVPAHWRLMSYGDSPIRAASDPFGICHCPITALVAHRTGHKFEPDDWAQSLRYIDLDEDFAERLIDAADNSSTAFRPLRLRLLEVCNL